MTFGDNVSPLDNVTVVDNPGRKIMSVKRFQVRNLFDRFPSACTLVLLTQSLDVGPLGFFLKCGSWHEPHRS